LREKFIEALKKNATKSVQKVVKSTVGNVMYFIPIAQVNSVVETFLVGLDASFADDEYLKHIAETGSLLRPTSQMSRMLGAVFSITTAIDDLTADAEGDADKDADEPADNNGDSDKGDDGATGDNADNAVNTDVESPDADKRDGDADTGDGGEDDDSDDEIETEEVGDTSVRAFDVTSDRFLEVLEEMNTKLKKRLISFFTGTDWSPSN
jgi:hypothetical protein